jgi:hypothetical protein
MFYGNLEFFSQSHLISVLLGCDCESVLVESAFTHHLCATQAPLRGVLPQGWQTDLPFRRGRNSMIA